MLVGVDQIGGQLDVLEFPGCRIPVADSVVARALGDRNCRSEIHGGPDNDDDLLGRERDSQYLELVLHDPESPGRVLGTLMVDDLAERGTASNRTLDKRDLTTLRPVADFAAEILALRNLHEHTAALRRHADGLRTLEDDIQTKVRELAATPSAEKAARLRTFLAERIKIVLRSEPELCGFHVRFLHEDDRLLHLYPGIGFYFQHAKAKSVSPHDPDSLSAKCFKWNSVYRDFAAHSYPPFLQFCDSVENMPLPDDAKAEVAKWCESVRILGCFPISSGQIRLGTLAIQSSSTDFFSTESVQYIKNICDLVARVVLPLRLEQDHHDFWENAAYAFRGPASNIKDIMQNLRMRDRDPGRKEMIDGAFALAQYLFTKANTFQLETRGEGAPSFEVTNKRLDELWDGWCGLFRGISMYGSKDITLSIKDSAVRDGLRGTVIRTSAVTLTEIVYNVFENAWKACHNTVEVVPSFEDQVFVIDIKDDGKGVSEEAIRKMFDGYHEDFEVNANRGSGLGLKWTKRHADALKVEIRPSAKGGIQGGAHFQIRIPASPGQDS